MQPLRQTGGHLRQALLEHGGHYLDVVEALAGQVASGKVQDGGGKAPHVCWVSHPKYQYLVAETCQARRCSADSDSLPVLLRDHAYTCKLVCLR